MTQNSIENLSNRIKERLPVSLAGGDQPPGRSDLPETPPIDYSHMFAILKNKRRRDVLQCVSAVDRQFSLGELAEQIAAWENDKSLKEITSQERKRVYVGLYQCHLPKMDDALVISFDKPRGTIEAGENLDFVTQFLPQNEDASRHLSI